jgi:hypothetical protein
MFAAQDSSIISSFAGRGPDGANLRMPRGPCVHSPVRILISNGDRYQDAGLRVLAEARGPCGSKTVVVPDPDRKGVGNSRVPAVRVDLVRYAALESSVCRPDGCG